MCLSTQSRALFQVCHRRIHAPGILTKKLLTISSKWTRNSLAGAKIQAACGKNASVISRLSAIGVIPGSIIKLIQKKPSIVLQVDETTIAIDHDTAKEIFVRRVSE